MNFQNVQFAVFFLDGVIDPDTGEDAAFYGAHDPDERWNGWAVPFLNDQQTRYLCEMLKANSDGINYLLEWEYDPNADEFVVTDDDLEEPFARFVRFERKGPLCGMFSVAEGLCWNVESEN